MMSACSGDDVPAPPRGGDISTMDVGLSDFSNPDDDATDPCANLANACQTENARRCEGAFLVQCMRDVQGCLVEEEIDCAAGGLVCDAMAMTPACREPQDRCPDSPNRCTVEGRQCRSDVLVICEPDANGCLVRSELSCVRGSTDICAPATEDEPAQCTLVDPCADITNPCDTAGQTCDGTTLVVCESDASGCLSETRVDCAERPDGMCQRADPSEPAQCASSQACVDTCASEGTRCEANTLVQCAPDAFGCLVEQRIDCTDQAMGYCDASVEDAAQCEVDIVDRCSGKDLCEGSEASRSCDASGLELTTCSFDEVGCLVRETTDCSRNSEVCTSDASGRAICATPCMDEAACQARAEGEQFCANSNLSECRDTNADGCLESVLAADCAAMGQICDTAAATPQCIVPCTDAPSCVGRTAGDAFCEQNAVTRCEDANRDGCLEAEVIQSCGATAQICDASTTPPTCITPCTDAAACTGRTNGEVFCNQNAITTCADTNADGCLEASLMPCANELCDSTQTPPICVPRCQDAPVCAGKTPSVAFCNGDVRTVCSDSNSDSCLEAAVVETCGPGLCDDSSGPASCLSNGSGDSCSNVIRMTGPSLQLSGNDFAADFTNQLDLIDVSCGAARNTTPEVIVAVDLQPGESVAVAEFGGLDSVRALTRTCGQAAACFGSRDDPDNEWIAGTATQVETVYIVVSAYSTVSVNAAYDIQVERFRCGDGAVSSIEGCDDGNLVSGDGCSSTCGVESGFTCSGQPSTCTAAVCGNGITEAVAREQCDDGNTTSGDGCSATCEVEIGYTCENSVSPSVCTGAVNLGTFDAADPIPTVNWNTRVPSGGNVLFRITFTEDVYLSGTLDGPSGTDPDFSVLDFNRNTLYSSAAIGDEAFSGVLLNAGTYLLNIRAFGNDLSGFVLELETIGTVCTPNLSQCINSQTGSETCNASGTAWVFRSCSLGCDPLTGRCVLASNDTCSQAIVIPPGGYSGRIEDYGADYNVSNSSCTGYTVTGPDALFEVQNVVAGEELQITVNSAFDAAVWISDSCVMDQIGTCLDGVDSGNPEVLTYVAPTAGDYYVVVAGYSSGAQGAFDVQIQRTAP